MIIFTPNFTTKWRICCENSFFIKFFLYLNLLTCLGTCLKIRPKLCTNAFGEEGRCMFVWECIKTEGKHLGTCVDGFLFGSCCGHNESENSITPNHDNINELSTTTTPSFSSTTTSLPVIKNKPWRPNHTKIPTTSTTTISSIIKTSTIPPSTTFKPHYTTSQRPWVIYTGKPNTPPSKPPIIWSLVTAKPGSWNPPPTSSTTTTTVKPTIVTNKPIDQWNMTNEFSETINRIPSSSSTENPTITNSPIVMTSEAFNHSTESTTTATNHDAKNSAKQQCGITQVKPRTKVVGGKNSAFGAWPWQVSVRRISFFGFSSTHRCGGAILNNEWIATAGHCVDDLLLTQIRIRVGEYDFSSALEPLPHIERGAKKKIVHPKYNFFTYENDLALVQLDKPLEFLPHVSPICLPPDDVELLGRNATVTGWGRLSEGGVLPTVLQEVRVPIISNDKCKNMFLSAGRHEYIPDIFMCAGYDAGGRDSCQGDSGGPLQVQGDDGRWFLAGIISWGIGCGEPSLPGVCTRISKFKSWISSYIWAEN